MEKSPARESHSGRRHETVAVAEAESALVGQPADSATFRKAAEAAMRDAKAQSENGSRSNWQSVV